jgi:hypothetical protein
MKTKTLAIFLLLGLMALSGCGHAQSEGKTAVSSSASATALDAKPTMNNLQARLGECYSDDLTEATPTGWSVNQHALNETESKNIQWISKCVLPLLPGTAEERLDLVAKVTWWALREGVLELSSDRVFRYSLCDNGKGVDTARSATPLYNCESNIWQVGIAGGQAMNYSQKDIDEKTTAVINALGGGITEDELLDWTASLAGFGEGSKDYAGIMSSTDRVRRSWFVRNPLVGMLLTITEVQNECLVEGKSWCFDGNYDEAIKFSGTRANMLTSIDDLKKIFAP